MDRFEEMRNFVRIVDAGGITRAAETSHTAKSAVSRRLSDLETRLGVQLINRTTRRMTLTEAGQRLYDRSIRLLAELDDIETAMVDTDAKLSGRIRLAAPTTFGLHHLGPAINAFVAEYPTVEFDIDFNDRRVDLIEEGFDLAIRIGRLEDSRMMARRLARVSGVVAASPAYWARHGEPDRPDDLADHPGLHYSLAASSTWRYRHQAGSQGSVRVPTYMQANNGDFLRDAAIAGFGVILQPRFICHAAIKAGELQTVLDGYQWFTLAAYAVYPHTRNLPTRIRTFIDFLAATWGDEPHWEVC